MRRFVLGLVLLACSLPLLAAGPTIQISRATSAIKVDGDLSDAAWQNAAKIEKWWETNPGDNIEPKAKSVGWLTYDDRFFYAAFEFSDPDPKQIRAPFNDRDRIGGNTDDYAGIILDTRNDGKTAILFLVNPSNVQYDAVSDDTTGNEDNSPDFFWDSATKITTTGWTLEVRIPFSSLRYSGSNPSQWGIMMYRNWPRDRRYQMFANELPRGNNCFICNESKIEGLQGLPPGGHIVVAPYVTALSNGEATGGLGTPIETGSVGTEFGADMKWTPTPDMALDATINPDFSQIESDSAVISTNERFAIFFPEKRPFFLEGVELFNTPIQAVYTRTITSPRLGARTTGRLGNNAYTLLVAQDRGGGLMILPSALGSDFANQDFKSLVAIGRVRHDFGKHFLSFLFTDRENDGDSYNRVLGPDFQWKSEHHNLTGQFLLSNSKTPDRPDLSSQWNGEELSGHAGMAWYNYSSSTWDLYTEYKDIADDFRADNGFVPQVGYRTNFAEGGRTWFPKKNFFSRIRVFGIGEYDSQQNGAQLYRLLSAGFGYDGKYQSNGRYRYAVENVRASDTQVFQRRQLVFSQQFSLGGMFPQVGFSGWAGEQVDFANLRLGRGARIDPYLTIRPTNHLQLNVSSGVQWLNVPNGQTNRYDRLFMSQVERIRASYTFNSKMFVRLILENERTNRDQSLYTYPVDQHEGGFNSQLLFAYKLNWQTVMYVGYGDVRGVLTDENEFRPLSRQFFFKLSYAFQR